MVAQAGTEAEDLNRASTWRTKALSPLWVTRPRSRRERRRRNKPYLSVISSLESPSEEDLLVAVDMVVVVMVGLPLA